MAKISMDSSNIFQRDVIFLHNIRAHHLLLELIALFLFLAFIIRD